MGLARPVAVRVECRLHARVLRAALAGAGAGAPAAVAADNAAARWEALRCGVFFDAAQARCYGDDGVGRAPPAVAALVPAVARRLRQELAAQPWIPAAGSAAAAALCLAALHGEPLVPGAGLLGDLARLARAPLGHACHALQVSYRAGPKAGLGTRG